MKLDTVSPQWTYKPDVEAITGMSSVQLLIWPQGICVSGHGDDGTTMIARAFSFEPQSSGEVMNAIFMNEPLLAGPQPINKVWLAGERTLIIPQALYNDAMKAEWLAAVYYVEADEHIQVSRLDGENACAVFPVKQTLHMALKQFFPEGHIGTFSSRHINSAPAHRSFAVNITILGKMAMLGFAENHKLLVQQFMVYETTEDIVYRIAEVAGLYGHIVADTEVVISGVLGDLVALSGEMSAYYTRTQLCDHSSTIDFLTKLSLCAL